MEQEYANLAVQVGHKTRIVAQLKEELDRDVRHLILLNKEAMNLPADLPPVEETPREEGIA